MAEELKEMMVDGSSESTDTLPHGVIQEANFYMEINRFVRQIIKNPVKVMKESPEMLMNMGAFLPDTLY